LDTGTIDSLLSAGEFVRTVEQRQGSKIGSPEEIAWRMGLIDNSQLEKEAKKYEKSGYGLYLLEILGEN
jgi:glucose-1-phosphate thymidylyltransferase